MFQKLKGKPDYAELEREFNIQTMRLGDLELQISRLEKAKARCLQLLEDLNKKGAAIREAKVKQEVELKTAEGKNEIN